MITEPPAASAVEWNLAWDEEGQERSSGYNRSYLEASTESRLALEGLRGGEPGVQGGSPPGTSGEAGRMTCRTAPEAFPVAAPLDEASAQGPEGASTAEERVPLLRQQNDEAEATLRTAGLLEARKQQQLRKHAEGEEQQRRGLRQRKKGSAGGQGKARGSLETLQRQDGDAKYTATGEQNAGAHAEESSELAEGGAREDSTNSSSRSADGSKADLKGMASFLSSKSSTTISGSTSVSCGSSSSTGSATSANLAIGSGSSSSSGSSTSGAPGQSEIAQVDEVGLRSILDISDTVQRNTDGSAGLPKGSLDSGTSSGQTSETSSDPKRRSTSAGRGINDAARGEGDAQREANLFRDSTSGLGATSSLGSRSYGMHPSFMQPMGPAYSAPFAVLNPHSSSSLPYHLQSRYDPGWPLSLHGGYSYRHPGMQYVTASTSVTPSVMSGADRCERCKRDFFCTINHRRHIRLHRKLPSAEKEDLQSLREPLRAFLGQMDPAKLTALTTGGEPCSNLQGPKQLEALFPLADLQALVLEKRKDYSPHSPVAKKANLLLAVLAAGESDRESLVFATSPSFIDQLFEALDTASDHTFLEGGTSLAVQRFIFQGRPSPLPLASLELRDCVATLAFVLEHRLVAAYMNHCEKAALQRQQKLVEEEEELAKARRRKGEAKKKAKKPFPQKQKQQQRGDKHMQLSKASAESDDSGADDAKEDGQQVEEAKAQAGALSMVPTEDGEQAAEAMKEQATDPEAGPVSGTAGMSWMGQAVVGLFSRLGPGRPAKAGDSGKASGAASTSGHEESEERIAAPVSVASAAASAHAAADMATKADGASGSAVAAVQAPVEAAGASGATDSSSDGVSSESMDSPKSAQVHPLIQHTKAREDTAAAQGQPVESRGAGGDAGPVQAGALPGEGTEAAESKTSTSGLANAAVKGIESEVSPAEVRSSREALSLDDQTPSQVTGQVRVRVHGHHDKPVVGGPKQGGAPGARGRQTMPQETGMVLEDPEARADVCGSEWKVWGRQGKRNQGRRDNPSAPLTTSSQGVQRAAVKEGTGTAKWVVKKQQPRLPAAKPHMEAAKLEQSSEEQGKLLANELIGPEQMHHGGLAQAGSVTAGNQQANGGGASANTPTPANVQEIGSSANVQGEAGRGASPEAGLGTSSGISSPKPNPDIGTGKSAAEFSAGQQEDSNGEGSAVDVDARAGEDAGVLLIGSFHVPLVEAKGLSQRSSKAVKEKQEEAPVQAKPAALLIADVVDEAGNHLAKGADEGAERQQGKEHVEVSPKQVLPKQELQGQPGKQHQSQLQGRGAGSNIQQMASNEGRQKKSEWKRKDAPPDGASTPSGAPVATSLPLEASSGSGTIPSGPPAVANPVPTASSHDEISATISSAKPALNPFNAAATLPNSSLMVKSDAGDVRTYNFVHPELLLSSSERAKLHSELQKAATVLAQRLASAATVCVEH